MSNYIDFFNILASLPCPILLVVAFFLVIAYPLHVKNVKKELKKTQSNYDILKSLNSEKGQMTIYPQKMKNIRFLNYKYCYECTLTINPTDLLEKGFHLELISNHNFLITTNSSKNYPSNFTTPYYSVSLNSDLFDQSAYCLNKNVYSLNFAIFSTEEKIKLNFKAKWTNTDEITSAIHLSP